MKYAYFSLPETLETFTSDDPRTILDNALYLKKKKNQATGLLDTVKQKLGIYKPPTLSDNVMNTVHDIGAGSGVGMTMLGGKLKQSPMTNVIGRKLKTHGIDTVLDPDLQFKYGLAVPTAGLGIGAGIGAAGLIANKNEDAYE